MPKPLIMTITHELGREGAKRRIESSVNSIRSQLSVFATSIEDHWTGDQLDFRLITVGQVVTGRIEVFEEIVRVEVTLPRILTVLADRIIRRIRDQGTAMLEKT